MSVRKHGVEHMSECCSEPKLSLLGRIPPRTPGRSDAQVPREAELGPARYARIAHLYFYEAADASDPAYGLLDLEISLQCRHNGEVWLEAFCVGDGYQSGRGSGNEHPLMFEVRSGERTLAKTEWKYPQVLCGHFDPMTFAIRTSLSPSDFEAANQIFLPSVKAVAESCMGAPPTLGGPEGH
jgi:hypothetical protein